jgi:hypothetical protein
MSQERSDDPRGTLIACSPQSRAVHSTDVSFVRNRPLGLAFIDYDFSVALGVGYKGNLVPGLLRSLGSTQMWGRYPCAVSASRTSDLIKAYRSYLGSNLISDPCLIIVHGCELGQKEANDNKNDSQEWDIAMLSEDQLSHLGIEAPAAPFFLPTSERLIAVCPDLAHRSSEVTRPVRYDLQAPVFRDRETPPNHFYALPPSQFASGRTSPNAFTCEINESHRRTFGRSMVVIRNPYLEKSLSRASCTISYSSQLPEVDPTELHQPTGDNPIGSRTSSRRDMRARAIRREP